MPATPRIALTILAGAALAAPVAAHASVPGPGTYHTCAKSAWIEKAPANRPIGLEYKNQKFTVTDATGKVTHPSSGPAQRWVKGYKVETRRGKAVKTVGWMKTTDLAKSC